jgi:hypothetical protein
VHRRVPAPTAAIVFVLAVLPGPDSTVAAQDTASGGPATPAERYEALAAEGYYAGLVELWREAPESAIPVIDSDLEGSLALWEEHGAQRADEIAALIERALLGARAATEATGRRRILDYVTSFAGWDAEQKAAFRQGQQAFRSGREALRAGDARTALERGRSCRDLAEPLGDWWGTAMGLQLEGQALVALDRREEAVTPLARARLVYRELGLTASALRIEVELADLLLELGREPRARAMIEDGLSTARRLGMDDLAERFSELGEGR